MRSLGKDPEVLRSVRPGDFVAYLQAHHWIPEETLEERDSFWTLDVPREGEQELLVPLKQDFKDYPLRISEALQTLELTEGRPFESILRDVINAAYDLVSVRVDSPRGADGSLKLDDGVTLFDNARKLIASAARSTIDPRPQYVAGMPSEVTDYLERVRLGQTERGSYIVNILSPTTRLTGDLVLFAPQILEKEDPFESRVIQTLGRALDATQTAVNQGINDPELTKFNDAVPQGVSANLCEAIARIGQSGGSTGVQINLKWALARRLENVPDFNVYFSATHIPVIEDAGKRLRNAPSREEQIQGYVVRLARERGLEDSGVVTIYGLVDDKLRRITVELPPEDYQRAVRAHEEDSAVFVYGKLARRGKSFILQEPRDLEILSDTEVEI